jgi:hypothetical protein
LDFGFFGTEFSRDLVAETAQDDVLRMHDELIDTILEEEEQLLTDHRTEIEDTMHLVKDVSVVKIFVFACLFVYFSLCQFFFWFCPISSLNRK